MTATLDNLTPAQKSVLQTIKTQREKLDAKVNAAIAERDAFIASISDAAGHIHNSNRRRLQVWTYQNHILKGLYNFAIFNTRSQPRQ